MFKIMLRFNISYFLITLFLFFVEVLIAQYAHDELIRPYGGDFLVVIFLYTLIRSFLNTPVLNTSIAVLLFSYILETLQYFKLVEVLGLEEYATARLLIGTSFAWGDLLAYTLGILLVLGAERLYVSKIHCVETAV